MTVVEKAGVLGVGLADITGATLDREEGDQITRVGGIMLSYGVYVEGWYCILSANLKVGTL